MIRPAHGPKVVLAAGLRTPQAKAGGRFRDEDAGHLGALVARELLARSGVDPAELDEVIVGCAGPPHDQANLGRVIGLRAGVPAHVPGRTVARNCASGFEAVTSAIHQIHARRGELFLCLGVEVMSAYPLHFGKPMTRLFEQLMRAKTLGARLSALATFRPSFLKPRIALMEGLTDPSVGMIMGSTAELLAREWNVTREDADELACASHHRAQAARNSGRFQREILPVLPLGARPDESSLQHDDGIRDGQDMAALAKLRPFFEKPDGTVTAGNSSQVTDGACALLVCTEDRARELGLQPLARVVDFAWAGLDPARMGLGPVHATARLFDRTGARLQDVGVVELNEAFAAQVIACRKAFASDAFAREHLDRPKALGELDPTRLNTNGGGVALGHPVGCTGARLLLTTAHQLQVSDSELGLATLCIGGGQGGAFLLERAS